MTENTDGVQHTKHPRHRHAAGDHSVSKQTDGGSDHKIVADKAATKMSHQAWGAMEDDHKKFLKHAPPGAVSQAAEKVQSTPTDLKPGTRSAKAEPAHFQPIADNKFNYQQPVHKLIESGAFKASAQPGDNTMGAKVEAQAPRDVNRNPVKNIDVRYSDTPVPYGQTATKPDFRVKQDGTVEVLHNPDQTRNSKITIEVERPPGDAGRGTPPEAQQKSVNQLVDYLSSRYMRQKLQPDGSIQRDGEIVDNQGLVGNDTRQAEKTRPSAIDKLPQSVQDQI